ncbi:MAG: hypothetical protein A3K06_01775 [Candidatus Doudnabacteria bacterium RIFCSPHIGHO2_01_52_17]|uniref:Uncharacterized protein n=1 Tax=Candidatus Doudnabacteria bacterium RIFCSPHIGHO2_01_52_17 TaxID=1817820 RepID=A0A1F5N918_9BACT|nr:MAG: hypothetical protein A3K06_01775 [Candidatus Doudnabacteria bacterium RIFCSPHIGHO2_01_52_17]
MLYVQVLLGAFIFGAVFGIWRAFFPQYVKSTLVACTYAIPILCVPVWTVWKVKGWHLILVSERMEIGVLLITLGLVFASVYVGFVGMGVGEHYTSRCFVDRKDTGF